MGDTAGGVERRVAIVRHGKAERDSPTGLDIDRPLRPRGERQAAWLGQWLASEGFSGAALLASPAARTRATAALIGEGIGSTVAFDDRLLVDRPASEGLAVIEGWSGLLVIVGHNPQVSRLASIGAGDLAGGVGMRTGECAVVRVSGAVGFGGGSVLEAMVRLDESG